MTSATENLGVDTITRGKALYFLFSFFLFAFLAFTTANSPENRGTALFYALLGIGSLTFVIFDFISKKKDLEFIDSVTYEPADTRPFFFKKVPNYLFVIMAIALVFFLASRISLTQSSFVGSPTFAALPFFASLEFSALLSGIAGLAENAFFFALMFPTLVAIMSRFFKFPLIVNVVVGVMFLSFIFTGYHFFVYGLTNIPATAAVWAFAFINGWLVYAFRNLFLSDVFHFSNNFMSTFVGAGGRVGFVIFGGG